MAWLEAGESQVQILVSPWDRAESGSMGSRSLASPPPMPVPLCGSVRTTPVQLALPSLQPSVKSYTYPQGPMTSLLERPLCCLHRDGYSRLCRFFPKPRAPSLFLAPFLHRKQLP